MAPYKLVIYNLQFYLQFTIMKTIVHKREQLWNYGNCSSKNSCKIRSDDVCQIITEFDNINRFDATERMI